MHGIPHFAISIALEREGQLVAGVVYNPVTDDLFTAEKGHGAYLNNKRLRVAARKELAPSVIATGLPFMGKAGHARASAEMAAVMNVTPASAASAPPRWTWPMSRRAASTASGSAACRPGTSRPGIVLVREAGGVVTDLNGGADMLARGTVLAANEYLHPQLLKLLKGVKAPDHQPSTSSAGERFENIRMPSLSKHEV